MTRRSWANSALSLGACVTVGVLLAGSALGQISGQADPYTRALPPQVPGDEVPPYAQIPAPESHVLDSAKVMDEGRTAQLSAYLLERASQDGVQVYLATQEQTSGLSAGELAAKYRREWLRDTDLGGVLVFNPINRTFGISVTNSATEFLEPGTLGTIVERCKETLTRQRNPAQTLREATMDFEYEIRSAKAGEARQSANMEPLVWGGALAGALLLGAGLIALVLHVHSQNYFGKPTMLPVYRMQSRLGARNSGGHHAEMEIR